VSVGEAPFTTDPALATGPVGPAGLAEVRAAAEGLGAVMDRLDPSVVTVDDAMAMLEVFTQIERMGAAGKTVIAKRATDSERLLRHKGYRDGVDYLARATDSTVGEAAAVLATADALEGLDATTDAVKAGGMSPRRAVAVAAAARANPDTEQEMLAIAETGSLREVQERSRQICRDASTETDEQRAARLRRRRSVRHGIDADSGEGWGRWRLPPAEHAELVAELNHRKQVFFDAARRAKRREGDDTYLADALVDLARHPASARPAPGSADADAANGDALVGAPSAGRTRWNQKVLVRVDGTAAQRGHPLAGERCEIAGVGPISGAEVRDLLASDAAKAVVVTDPDDHNQIQAIAHLGRAPLDRHAPPRPSCRRRRSRRRRRHPRPPGSPADRRAGDGHRVDLWWPLPDQGQRRWQRAPRDRPRTTVGAHPPHRAERAHPGHRPRARSQDVPGLEPRASRTRRQTRPRPAATRQPTTRAARQRMTWLGAAVGRLD
jgi:hypothetical protein